MNWDYQLTTVCPLRSLFIFFFFNDTATTEIYTLSLHDALPISGARRWRPRQTRSPPPSSAATSSEEHTSELQSHVNLVCRLLLEKKKTNLIDASSSKKQKINNNKHNKTKTNN